MSWIDDLLGKDIMVDGVKVPARKILQFLSGSVGAFTVADNPGNNSTDITVATPGSSGANALSVLGRAANSNGVLAPIQATPASGLPLRENGAGVLSFGTLGTAAYADASVTIAKLADLAGMSVLGRSGFSAGVMAAITAGVDGFILRRVGNTIGFGKALTNFITGTATNDNAAAGDIGEYTESRVLSGAATSLVNATGKTVTSISLSAGDWDVSGVVAFSGSPTGASFFISSISTTNNTRGAAESNESVAYATATTVPVYPTPVVRISVASTTTVYLVAVAAFSGGTVNAYGTIRARRAR